MYNIRNENEFLKFVEILPDLKDGEAFFLCLAARGKYLSEEERKVLGFKPDKMFSHQIVTDKKYLKYYVEKSLHMLSFKTKEGKQIPEKASVVYFGINPISLLKGYLIFQTNINTSIVEQSLNDNPQFSYTNNIVSKLYSSLQIARSRNIYLDIDIDSTDFNSISILLEALDKQKDIVYHIIKTRGGYHILILRETLKGKDINLSLILKEIEKSTGKEAIINKNQLVPVPGTLQGGIEVSLIGVKN